ncbi:uncharacterized protein A1O5_00723 [Cladophialophora psammophila CBS 110553]|uniref:Uncharacterized protein n=1 Tax=Cladophialophora psammophila CBS 110553 TaxID=1182543 RepID=W9XFU4_9EURO|nr:uncharacterized protein A1O5_00723 [Cladophialophora psammophila CBS 110553]EXJ76215.1 hypothetical protein A1O5_00723 [Cladophialophora psammophila CBS 110553]
MAHLTASRNKSMEVASKYYGSSIMQLREILINSELCTNTLTVVLTLMMAEVYSGQSRSWRHHLQGAWDLFRNFRAQSPWKDSELTCASLQSLFIISLVGDTSRLDNGLVADQGELAQSESGYTTSLPHDSGIIEAGTASSATLQDQESIFMIKSTLDFGFTIGATQEILDCISCINDMNRVNKWSGPNDNNYRTLLGRLDACRASLADKSSRVCGVLNNAAYYQLGAFVAATYIYFYRSFFDLSPMELHTYIVETFDYVNCFVSGNYGNFSLWPAFIAAVEAYSDETMSMVGEWLDTAMSFGLGSRVLVRKVIEETWRRRDIISREIGLDKGLVAVDWRRVIKDWDVDVLLV